MKQIILATKNKNKLVEVKAVLGNDYEVLSMEDIGIDVDVEENGTTFEENATIKAEAICKICGKPVMADDSGLEIDYLDKKPGVLSARFLGHDTSVFTHGWPKYDESKLKEETVNIAVQINGKVKVQLSVDPKTDKDTVLAAAKAALGDKLSGNIVKEIYVPGRIVNIVVK